MYQLPALLPLRFCHSTGGYQDLFSPNDHTYLTKVQYATEADLELLLSRLRSARATMKAIPVRQRSSLLRLASQRILENKDYLAWLISTEGGKPLRDSRVEVDRAAVTLDLCAEEALRSAGETVPMQRTAAGENHLAFTLRDPIGVVLAISAFNHPLNLICHQVGSAIASGCPVVLKPAPATPLCASKLDEIFREVGLPEGIFFVVHSEIPGVEKLLASSEFDYVSFIGSAAVGWSLRSKIAPGTRLALEHGGQAPAIVRADADLDLAIPSLVKGAFYHAGQVCVSTQRIFVAEPVYEKFLRGFIKATKLLQVGPATSERTDVGPLIRPKEVLRLQSWIQEAVNSGAAVESGNTVSGTFKQYLDPTILTNVSRDDTLMKEEAFGPVVCVNSYRDETELLEYLDSNDYKFEASLFTRDLARAMQIAESISTMTLVINNHSAFRVDNMPFGGHKLSGLGMGGVKYSVEEMTRVKQIIIRT
ncbi:MAG TPA: aldehyde dehydrogenase family protein [Bacteriovoracaceae bacterium]|nr:aldehyde dehydrogenase family protein [Bacteriovoracaceae bacterium]